jgi:hypothetical protein
MFFQNTEHQSSGLPNLLRRVAMKPLSALVEIISRGEQPLFQAR